MAHASPSGAALGRLPTITERCTGCGRCVAVCAPHVLWLESRDWRLEKDRAAARPARMHRLQRLRARVPIQRDPHGAGDRRAEVQD